MCNPGRFFFLHLPLLFLQTDFLKYTWQVENVHLATPKFQFFVSCSNSSEWNKISYPRFLEENLLLLALVSFLNQIQATRFEVWVRWYKYSFKSTYLHICESEGGQTPSQVYTAIISIPEFMIKSFISHRKESYN